jgi:hypothetical protein
MSIQDYIAQLCDEKGVAEWTLVQDNATSHAQRRSIVRQGEGARWTQRPSLVTSRDDLTAPKQPSRRKSFDSQNSSRQKDLEEYLARIA